MIRIGIDINDVIRDFIGQLEFTYNKYKIGNEVDIEENPVLDFDLIKYFPMEGGITRLNKFMYEDVSLEIFGHADELHTNLIDSLNLFNMEVVDEGDYELILISREAVRSIPATFFFLSKTGCQLSNIKFSTQYDKMWGGIDVMVTANPILLESVPKNKKVIKINTTYNKGINIEHSFDTLKEFMDTNIGNIINN